jgi:hypothetical protein
MHGSDTSRTLTQALTFTRTHTRIRLPIRFAECDRDLLICSKKSMSGVYNRPAVEPTHPVHRV